MAMFRMYTGEDGHSHLEELQRPSQSTEGTDPITFEAFPVWEIKFNELPVDYTTDWHPAPRRRYFFMLRGELELRFRDGTSHRLTPGDVTLCEDTTGSGHIYRISSDVSALTAVVELSD